MAYTHDNLARQMSAQPVRRYEHVGQEQQQARPRLDVIEGARASEGVWSPAVGTALTMAKVVGVYFVILCLVVLTIMGVTQLVLAQDNALISKISDARAVTSQLEVQVTMQEDPARILGYSTKIYGMVPATEVQNVAVGDQPSVISVTEVAIDESLASYVNYGDSEDDSDGSASTEDVDQSWE